MGRRPGGPVFRAVWTVHIAKCLRLSQGRREEDSTMLDDFGIWFVHLTKQSIKYAVVTWSYTCNDWVGCWWWWCPLDNRSSLLPWNAGNVERLPQISAWSAPLFEFPWSRSLAFDESFREPEEFTSRRESISDFFNLGDSRGNHKIK